MSEATETTMACYLVELDDQGRAHGRPTSQPLDALPEGDVLIRVAYSSLNYKDALSATGNRGVTRHFPHVPGIDAAGTVVESRSPKFSPGQKVLVTGFDLGQNTWGGWAQYVRVPSGWVVPLPEGLSLRESMIFGTAGFTAAMSVEAILHHDVTPESGEVVVTGASGGVGSLAVAMLSKLGFRVVAISGKPHAHDFLRQLGAAEVAGRDTVNDTSDKPLLRGRWAAAVDTVGGNTLATVIRSTKHHACVAACGLVGGVEMSLTVFPFILRGVCLCGIDSAEWPIQRRPALWQKMAGPWRPNDLETLVAKTVTLEQLDEVIQQILKGEIIGRVLVRPGDEKATEP